MLKSLIFKNKKSIFTIGRNFGYGRVVAPNNLINSSGLLTSCVTGLHDPLTERFNLYNKFSKGKHDIPFKKQP